MNSLRTTDTENQKPAVSIGMPVFNGEKYIEKAIESLLNQTFSNFELIISDNASTDKTQSICLDYANQDKRIKYIRQTQNQGAIKNFEIVLKTAIAPYFMWAASDDFWYPSFLEKNYTVLQKQPQVVASISRVKMERIMNKSERLVGTYPISGTYSQRLKQYFKCLGANSRFYSLYRTKAIQKAFTAVAFMGGMDGGTLIKVLEYGDFYELDEILMERSCYGSSSQLLIDQFESYNIKGIEKLFPLFQLTLWLWKNLDIKIFIQCIDYIVRLNIFFTLIVISEFLHIRKPKKYPN